MKLVTPFERQLHTELSSQYDEILLTLNHVDKASYFKNINKELKDRINKAKQNPDTTLKEFRALKIEYIIVKGIKLMIK